MILIKVCTNPDASVQQFIELLVEQANLQTVTLDGREEVFSFGPKGTSAMLAEKSMRLQTLENEKSISIKTIETLEKEIAALKGQIRSEKFKDDAAVIRNIKGKFQGANICQRKNKTSKGKQDDAGTVDGTIDETGTGTESGKAGNELASQGTVDHSQAVLGNATRDVSAGDGTSANRVEG